MSWKFVSNRAPAELRQKPCSLTRRRHAAGLFLAEHPIPIRGHQLVTEVAQRPRNQPEQTGQYPPGERELTQNAYHGRRTPMHAPLVEQHHAVERLDVCRGKQRACGLSLQGAKRMRASRSWLNVKSTKRLQSPQTPSKNSTISCLSAGSWPAFSVCRGFAELSTAAAGDGAVPCGGASALKF